MLCSIAYDTVLKRPGCVLLQAVTGATITNSALAQHFDVRDWLLAPTPDLKVYQVADEDQLQQLARITRNRRKTS